MGSLFLYSIPLRRRDLKNSKNGIVWWRGIFCISSFRPYFLISGQNHRGAGSIIKKERAEQADIGSGAVKSENNKVRGMHMKMAKYIFMALVVAAGLCPWFTNAATFSLKFDFSKLDNADVKPENFYVIIAAKLINKGITDDNMSFLLFNKVGQYNGKVPCSSATSLTSYYSINDFAPLMAGQSGLTFINIPNCASGRAFIMYGKKLAFPNGGEPDPCGDAQGTIYDKIEFTLDAQNQLYINTTAVDFMSIPVTVSDGTNTKGITDNWTSITSKFDAAFSAAGVCPFWKSRCMTYINDGRGSQTLARIMAPGKLPMKNADREFPPEYLTKYIATIWKYYSDNPKKIIKIDCAEVADDCKLGTNTVFTGTLKSSGGNTYWSFTNESRTDGTTQTVDLLANPDVDKDQNITRPNLGVPTSSEVFGANPTGPLYGENKTVKSVLGKFLYVSLAAGLMPFAEDSVTLKKEFFVGKQGVAYKPNPLAMPPDGDAYVPWTTLYAKVLHDGGYPIYGYAYDDVFGWDSTIKVDTTQTPNPMITCTLSSMNGRVMPAVGAHTMALQNDFCMAGGAEKMTYNGHKVSAFYLQIYYKDDNNDDYFDWVAGKGIVTKDNQTLRNPTITTPLKVKYGYVVDDGKNTRVCADGDSIDLDDLGNSTIKTPVLRKDGITIDLPPPNQPK